MESRRLRLPTAGGRSSSSLSTTSSTSSSIMSDMLAARYHRRSRANRSAAAAAGSDDDSSFTDNAPRTWICTDRDLNRPYNATARPCSSKDSRPSLSLLASRNAKNLMESLDDVTGKEDAMSETTTAPARTTSAHMMASERTTDPLSSSRRRHRSSRSSTSGSRTTRGRRKRDIVVSANEHESEGRFEAPPAMTPMFGANVDTRHASSMSSRPSKPRGGSSDTIPVPPSRRSETTTTTSRDIMIALDTVPATAKTRFDPLCVSQNIPNHSGRKWITDSYEPEYAKPAPSLSSRRLDVASKSKDSAKPNSNYTVYPMEASSMRSLYSTPRTLDAVFGSNSNTNSRLQRHESRRSNDNVDDIDDDDSGAQSVRLALEEQENEMFMLALELSIHDTTDTRRRHDDAGTISDMDSDLYLTDSDDEFW